MSPLAPRPENLGFAFRGEAVAASHELSSGEAQALLEARNPTGRPNTDVLRRALGCGAHGQRERWTIDFSPHFTAQEAALYAAPFAQVAPKWQSRAANLELRTALARLDRYLATPADFEVPTWEWVEADTRPDRTLLVFARDDDFSHGILTSRIFAAWWLAHRAAHPPESILASFPFPWPPGTPLGALSRAQEEHRHALARAARSGDREAIDSAAIAAYGWPGESNPRELTSLLAKFPA